MENFLIEKLLDVGITISKEKSPDKLFRAILETVMDITGCDGGNLYVSDKEGLHLNITIIHSQNINRGGMKEHIKLQKTEANTETESEANTESEQNTETQIEADTEIQNICVKSAAERKIFRISDIYTETAFDFSEIKKYDRDTGYRTRSMLIIPMEDDKEKVIGVMQFTNAANNQGETVPFTKKHEKIACSLASQAAVCLTNRNYAEALQDTLDSMVGTVSTAIDALTPYNANHTKSMAEYAKNFITWMNSSPKGITVSRENMRRFLMTIYLHDVGKLVTPLTVMNKNSRLGGREKDIHARFTVIELLSKIRLLEGHITNMEFDEIKKQLEKGIDLIERVNSAGVIGKADLKTVRKLAEHTYEDERGNLCSWITHEELKMLSVERGNLTQEERQIMENHVVMTAKILGEMRFPEEDSSVPLWAADHHEFLDGTGYPFHKRAEQLSFEVRLLTILDIFDALTARDRPYKPPVSVETALNILESMAEEGKLDKEIIALFKESRAWKI